MYFNYNILVKVGLIIAASRSWGRVNRVGEVWRGEG